MIRKINKIFMSSFLIVSVVVGAFSFVNVKADTITPITTSSYGSYFAETYYYESQNTYIDNITITTVLVDINISNINSSAFHLHYDFNELYSGTITISITSGINWKLSDCNIGLQGGWFETVPNSSSTAKIKQFVIGVYESPGIDLVVGHEGRSVSTAVFPLSTTYSISYNLHTEYDTSYYLDNIDDRLIAILSYCGDIFDIYDYMTTDMDDTLSDILTNTDTLVYYTENVSNYLNNLVSFNVPIEMIPAYCVFSPAFQGDEFLIQNPDELYPYITFTGELRTVSFRIEPETTLYLYYLGSTTYWHDYLSNDSFTLDSSRLTDYQIAGKSIFRVAITNPTQTSATTRYSINYYSVDSQTGVQTSKSGTITPLYFGSGVGMSDSMRSLLGIEDPLVSVLQDFLDNSVVPSGIQTIFNEVLTSIGDFYSHIVDFLPNKRVFTTDMLDASNNPEYRITDCLSFVDYFYGEMITTFPALQTFTVLGLSVMVIRMFIK